MDEELHSPALTVVEICAGAGGQSLGLHRAGFRHALAVELDSDAADTLRRNLSRLASEEGGAEAEVVVGDVADENVWRPSDSRGVSLLAGGVPCPPFSIAGRQLGTSDERDLFAWAVEAAGVMMPDAVLLENVRGLAMPRFAGYRQAVIDRFAELGYTADWRLLEAKDFGVPQLRPRFILVALRHEFAPFFAWPSPNAETQSVGAALERLMAANGWRGAKRWAERARGIAPTVVGGSKKHGGPDLGPTRAKRAWLELGVDGHGIADEAPSADASLDHMPRLTNEMVARVQGWGTAGYEWDFGSPVRRKTSIYRQIGNAFPPPVAKAVGDSIAAALRKEHDGSADIGMNGQSHDRVYAALRNADDFLSVESLAEVVAGGIAMVEIERNIEYISRDFEVETIFRHGRTLYKLGEWRAFRGQQDHLRHAAYADESKRSRMS